MHMDQDDPHIHLASPPGDGTVIPAGAQANHVYSGTYTHGDREGEVSLVACACDPKRAGYIRGGGGGVCHGSRQPSVERTLRRIHSRRVSDQQARPKVVDDDCRLVFFFEADRLLTSPCLSPSSSREIVSFPFFLRKGRMQMAGYESGLGWDLFVRRG